jgi:hypothetical protein
LSLVQIQSGLSERPFQLPESGNLPRRQFCDFERKRAAGQRSRSFFLVLSVFTGGFNFKLWSMLDTSLMIQSIVVTALVVVLEEPKHRRLAFNVAIVLYLLAVLDMGIDVCISGVVGWKT